MTGAKECVDAETGEVVATVQGRCSVCNRSRWPGWPETPRLVHHGGTEHIPAWDDETTLCGEDATGDDWWWAL